MCHLTNQQLDNFINSLTQSVFHYQQEIADAHQTIQQLQRINTILGALNKQLSDQVLSLRKQILRLRSQNAVINPSEKQNKTASKFEPGKYKSEPCMHWKRKGRCEFGKHCWFKHGDDDLGARNKSLVNEFKHEQTSQKYSSM